LKFSKNHCLNLSHLRQPGTNHGEELLSDLAVLQALQVGSGQIALISNEALEG
jgi:hypothetical protein